MNRAEVKANAEVMLAFVNGKTIQNRRRGCGKLAAWNDISPYTSGVPNFTFEMFEYRIKPEPETFVVSNYGQPLREFLRDLSIGRYPENAIGGVYANAAEGKTQTAELGNRRLFKVTEVLPE